VAPESSGAFFADILQKEKRKQPGREFISPTARLEAKLGSDLEGARGRVATQERAEDAGGRSNGSDDSPEL